MNKLIIASLALTTTFSALVSQAQDAALTAASPSTEPAASSAPSAPPTTMPAPPQPPNAAEAPAPVPQGQWTYTNQYGWLWTPYARPYTYVYDDSDVAYSYVYYPSYGWRWVSSPWVLGVGPAPYWGVHGRVGFAWYAHPWFHGSYGGGYHGYRSGYARGGYAHASPHVSAHVSVGGSIHGGGGFHSGGGHGRR